MPHPSWGGSPPKALENIAVLDVVRHGLRLQNRIAWGIEAGGLVTTERSIVMSFSRRVRRLDQMERERVALSIHQCVALPAADRA